MQQQVDVNRLAEALNLSPNTVRVRLGIPTELQQQTRRATKFEQIVLFEPEQERHRSCGSKFDPVEIAEYEAKRSLLFTEYLDGFKSVAAFETIGGNLNRTELTLTQAKFNTLASKTVEAITTVSELESLVDSFKDFSSWTQSILIPGATEFITRKARTLFLTEIRDVQSIDKAIEVFVRYQSFADLITKGISGSWTHPWSHVWLFANHFSELVELQTRINRRFTDDFNFRDGTFTGRLFALMNEAWDTFQSFDEALKAALSFSSHDERRLHFRDKPDEVYTQALELTISHIQSKKDLGVFLSVWGRRDQRFSKKNSHAPRPTLPVEIRIKWDELYVPDLDRGYTVGELRELLSKVRVEGTNYEFILREKLGTEFAKQVSAAQSLDELLELEKSDDIKEFALSEFYARRWEFMNERNLKIIEDGNDKEALIRVYHQFRENSEKSSLILRKLIPFFLVEKHDVVEV